MNMLDKALRAIAPGMAVARERNRRILDILQTNRYDAATSGNRGKSFRNNATDADAAGRSRAKLAFISRDMIRNTPFAGRAMQVISNNVVGDGIIPKIVGGDKKQRESMFAAIEAHFDTSAIDADGRTTLYGLQRLAMLTVVESGEVLIRRRRRDPTEGFELPFQIQILEPDHLDSTRDGTLANGNSVREGIEYDLIGRRAAYWLFPEHPGASGWSRKWPESRRVPASEILHIYRQDRPGQMRGVPWFAPVAMKMQDIADHDDAQLMRQKIAACFAAFVKSTEPDGVAGNETMASLATSIVPGRIQRLAAGDDVEFGNPPGVQGYDEFTAWGHRAVAAGLGITYESYTGDLSRVNFTSYKAGRIEMNRNVSAWQWHMMVPNMLHPIGRWAVEGWTMMNAGKRSQMRLDWVPPVPPLIDPNRELPAMVAKVRAGFDSKQGIIRELGKDPERVTLEIIADMAEADAASPQLVFDSDARRVSGSGVTNARPVGMTYPEDGATQ